MRIKLDNISLESESLDGNKPILKFFSANSFEEDDEDFFDYIVNNENIVWGYASFIINEQEFNNAIIFVQSTI